MFSTVNDNVFTIFSYLVPSLVPNNSGAQIT